MMSVVMSTIRWGATAHTRARVTNVGPAYLLFLVISADFTNEVTESIIDVDSLLSRCLDEFAVKVACQITALIHTDLSLVLEIAFVSDDNHWKGVLVLYAKNLLVESRDFFKGVARGDRVNQKETLSRAHVLFPHGAVFFLSCSIEDVEKRYLVVDDTLLAVRVLDGWVVLIHEVALDELDGKCGLADTTTADHDELVLAKELSLGHDN